MSGNVGDRYTQLFDGGKHGEYRGCEGLRVDDRIIEVMNVVKVNGLGDGKPTSTRALVPSGASHQCRYKHLHGHVGKIRQQCLVDCASAYLKQRRTTRKRYDSSQNPMDAFWFVHVGLLVIRSRKGEARPCTQA